MKFRDSRKSQKHLVVSQQHKESGDIELIRGYFWGNSASLPPLNSTSMRVVEGCSVDTASTNYTPGSSGGPNRPAPDEHAGVGFGCLVASGGAASATYDEVYETSSLMR